MFKSPFSFKGRIRRTEYGISTIIYFVIIVAFELAIMAMAASSDSIAASIIFIFLLIPVIYFMLAQGAKRCHDRGNSGWYQLIPFYGLWMLFAESDPGDNEYGPNPKGIGNIDFSFEQSQEQLNS
ncbi:MAG: DUF805 domain-containing protein [Flavisolibacter sp.]|jgi:uncharacterized membrane protein YhaH (DUF805 family)|nr:DUF805 domain-containing protein [Flavisolibacter sp.]